MHCENDLFMTLNVKVAGNLSVKIWKIAKTWALELRVGREKSNKLNNNVHEDLNLTLNDQVYNRNYNAHI